MDSLVRQARGAAARAATRAGVQVMDESGMGPLRDVAALLTTVWGTSPEGVPIPSDVLRGISHAGCSVAAARDGSGALIGAAVAIVSPGRASAYSLIAAVRPEAGDTGIGFALKQHQRAWALGHGLESMTWTFDPLVSRNARFNLTKLGAHGAEYVPDFYGQMTDEINSGESDRLVALWPLASERTIACSTGDPSPIELPELTPEDITAAGPDGHPQLARTQDALWCRVPRDVVALRAQDPAQAARWRRSVRDALVPAFGSGYRAVGVTRSGWYQLTAEGQR